ncbi:hypothetical protein GL4_1483 [Methyloceanibacter caenitepidi]|uniref:Uncharacterized protein n=2 Tax=Methyloceanibacter caenitepidi TaxID=1384459 RepID=A0A0A8K4M0_9HYPH|nr:hypothetical protein GL4_1483 [Methyloceanibacter caenitepidi]
MRPNGAVIRDAKDQENVKAMALMWPPLVGNCYEMTDGTLVASITADGRAALNQARATRGGLL